MNYSHEGPKILGNPRAVIVAASTLVKKLPLSLRRFIGGMSQTEQIQHGLSVVLQVIQVPASPSSH